MDKNKRGICLIALENYLNLEFSTFQKEVQFLRTRKFRFDYAISERKIAIEINGGQWVNGRHNRGGKAYEKDLEKLNLAQANGWRVLQYTYEQLAKREYEIHLQILKQTNE